MSAPAPLAVVTGANRGLGLEVCRQLGQRGMRVLVTSRDPRGGAEAVRKLVGEHTAARLETLDVTSPEQVAALADALAQRGEVVQALVNNAGASFDGFDAGVAERTLATNYFGAAAVMDALLPLMPPGGQVVLVSSGMGELSAYSPALRARFLAPDLDRAGVDALMREFVADVGSGEHGRKGWPSNAYRVSKAGLNALARVMAPGLSGRGIAINAVCPGWVRTDMGGSGAPRSVARGAEGIVWAATLPAGGPTGGFFRDGKPIPW
jgi:NAD(P)-dependent dehydrogenase (short-subunit alcohol dehydrogenase family)